MKKFLSFFVFIFFVGYAQSNTMRFAVTDSPPWVVVQNGKFSGIDISTSAMIAEQLGLTPEFFECPLPRCLAMAEHGQVDAIANVFYTSERADYLIYPDSPLYIDPPKTFYFRVQSSIRDIKKFDDLYPYTIGHVRAAKYFDLFDASTKLRKVPALNDELLVSMFLKGRFDLLIGANATIDYYLKIEGAEHLVKKASFHFSTQRPSFLGISKASPMANRMDDVNRVITSLSKAGAFERLQNAALITKNPN